MLGGGEPTAALSGKQCTFTFWEEVKLVNYGGERGGDRGRRDVQDVP